MLAGDKIRLIQPQDVLGEFSTRTFLWEIYIHSYSYETMDDSFYLTITIVATVILILSLTYVGMLLYGTKSTVAFPPTQSKCPDYWEIDSSTQKCKIPISSTAVNVGDLVFNTSGTTRQVDKTTATNVQYGAASAIDNTVGVTSGIEYSLLDVADNTWKSISIAGVNDPNNPLCNKARFARSLGIVWDGVSNTNQC